MSQLSVRAMLQNREVAGGVRADLPAGGSLRAWMQAHRTQAEVFHDVTVGPDDHVIAPGPQVPGEAQSTVIAPRADPLGVGRLVTSNDWLRPPSRDIVRSQQLDAPTGGVTGSTIEPVPNAAAYFFGTNDHDLVSFSDGELLYVTGAFSSRPVTPKPVWFDVTYRFADAGTVDLGPGARGVVLTWSSTDGGRTFRFVSEMDPAQTGDRSAAFPQWDSRVPGGRRTTPPGSPSRPAWSMGGTDGQLAWVDPITQTVYLTFQAVGYRRDESVADHFELSGEQLNFTWVLASTDRGRSWSLVGSLPERCWRCHVAAPNERQLAFGVGTRLYLAERDDSGMLSIDPVLPVPGAVWGWGDALTTRPKLIAAMAHVITNIHAHMIVVGTRWVDRVAFIYPSLVAGAGGNVTNGLRVAYFDVRRKAFIGHGDPIVPQARTQDSFTMHPVAVDLGDGTQPGQALLTWYDMDADAMTGTVRGRVISADGSHSPDFAVAQAGGRARSFSLATTPFFYGDYHTAGGFTVADQGSAPAHRYFPMWVEPDGSTHIADVTVRRLLPTVGPTGAPAGGDRLRPPDRATAQDGQPSAAEVEQLLGYGDRARHR